MKRHAFKLLTLLSLLLCVAVVAAWGWSYRRSDRLTWRWVKNGPSRTTWGDVHVSSAAGGVFLSTRRSRTWGAYVAPTALRDPLGVSWSTYRPPTYPRRVDGPRFDLERWGFAWDWKRSRSTRDEGEGDRTEEYASWLVIFPHAALALPLAVLPLGRLTFFAWRRSTGHRRAAACLCPACGYNLTGNPSGVCPECGGAAGGPLAGFAIR